LVFSFFGWFLGGFNPCQNLAKADVEKGTENADRNGGKQGKRRHCGEKRQLLITFLKTAFLEEKVGGK
jgi:hypothetical protein